MLSQTLAISSLYAALLGLLFIPFTLRVGLYRAKNSINLGDGGDPELLKRIRGQGNFIETAPLALILVILCEVAGGSSTLVHCLGGFLVVGRLSHYLQITGLIKPLAFRAVGMIATLSVYLTSSLWLLWTLYLG